MEKVCVECSGKVEAYRESNVCEKCLEKISKENEKAVETRYSWF